MGKRSMRQPFQAGLFGNDEAAHEAEADAVVASCREAGRQRQLLLFGSRGEVLQALHDVRVLVSHAKLRGGRDDDVVEVKPLERGYELVVRPIEVEDGSLLAALKDAIDLTQRTRPVGHVPQPVAHRARIERVVGEGQGDDVGIEPCDGDMAKEHRRLGLVLCKLEHIRCKVDPHHLASGSNSVSEKPCQVATATAKINHRIPRLRSAPYHRHLFPTFVLP
mmetsp:Transcript_15012/g.25692  ORF Transcript_15012/g.25692 Transcript_15012/m.25692 type:complete len:221 (-) Transcript_15012:382-1044(-)